MKKIILLKYLVLKFSALMREVIIPLIIKK
jgi:hypothetical protein